MRKLDIIIIAGAFVALFCMVTLVVFYILPKAHGILESEQEFKIYMDSEYNKPVRLSKMPEVKTYDDYKIWVADKLENRAHSIQSKFDFGFTSGKYDATKYALNLLYITDAIERNSTSLYNLQFLNGYIQGYETAGGNIYKLIDKLSFYQMERSV